jgi:hypothetical protein
VASPKNSSNATKAIHAMKAQQVCELKIAHRKVTITEVARAIYI